MIPDADWRWQRIIREVLPQHPSADGIPLWRVLAACAIIEICLLHIPVAVALKCFEIRCKAMS